MTTDLERELRAMMHRKADDGHVMPLRTAQLARRARLNRAATALVAGAAVVALVVGGSAVIGPRFKDRAIPPAHHNDGQHSAEEPGHYVITSLRLAPVRPSYNNTYDLSIDVRWTGESDEPNNLPNCRYTLFDPRGRAMRSGTTVLNRGDSGYASEGFTDEELRNGEPERAKVSCEGGPPRSVTNQNS